MKLLSLLTRLLPAITVILLISYKEGTSKPLTGKIQKIDTVRATLLVTCCSPKSIAQNMDGYIIANSDGVIKYLSDSKEEIKRPMMVWGWRAR